MYSTYVPTYVLYIHTYVRTYVGTYVPMYMHAYIRTYVRTYVVCLLTYTHVHMYVCTVTYDGNAFLCLFLHAVQRRHITVDCVP